MSFDVATFVSVGLAVGVPVLLLALTIWHSQRAASADRADLVRQMEAQGARIDALNGRVDALNSRMDTMHADLVSRIDAVNADLSRQLEAQGRRIDALNGRMDVLNGRVDTLNIDLVGQIEAQGRRIDGLSARLDHVQPVAAAESSPSPAYAVAAAPEMPESRPTGDAPPASAAAQPTSGGEGG